MRPEARQTRALSAGLGSRATLYSLTIMFPSTHDKDRIDRRYEGDKRVTSGKTV